MPIKFRCPSCKAKLAITSKKAGQEVPCPKCNWQVTVPIPEALKVKREQEAKAAHAPKNDSFQASEPDDNDVDDLDPFGDLEFDALRALSADVDTTSSPERGFEDEDQLDDYGGFEPAAKSTKPAPPEPEDDDLQLDALASESFRPEALEDQDYDQEPELGRLADSTPKPVVRRKKSKDNDEQFAVRKAKTDFEELDLTPMVDVTFLLLIFFMITASFSLQKAMEIPAPDPDKEGMSQQPQTLDELEETTIIVEIDQKNVVYVEEEPIRDLRDLAPRLEALIRDQQKNEVIITPDQVALTDTVIAVLDAANQAGMQRIRLATKKGDD